MCGCGLKENFLKLKYIPAKPCDGPRDEAVCKTCKNKVFQAFLLDVCKISPNSPQNCSQITLTKTCGTRAISPPSFITYGSHFHTFHSQSLSCISASRRSRTGALTASCRLANSNIFRYSFSFFFFFYFDSLLPNENRNQLSLYPFRSSSFPPSLPSFLSFFLLPPFFISPHQPPPQPQSYQTNLLFFFANAVLVQHVVGVVRPREPAYVTG